MTFLRRTFLHALLVLGLFTVSPLPGYAQVDLSSFSLTWNGGWVSELVVGDCFDLNAGPNAGGISLDIVYQIGGGAPQLIEGWPTLDGNGTAANICLDPGTPLGPRAFLQVRDHAWGSNNNHWFTSNYWLSIYPQAAGAGFSPTVGSAGIDSYIFVVSGVANRWVRIRYNWEYSYNLEDVIWVDGNGYYYSPVPLDHYSYAGYYLITAVQDATAHPDNWVPVSAPYYLYPPQPTSFWLDKSSLVAGGSNGTNMFHMFARNGADMAIDYTYHFGSTSGADYGWPYLYADGGANWEGRSSEIYVNKCTFPGNRYFDFVRNSLNSDWTYAGAMVNIVGAGAPSFSSISPVSANRGQSLTVTINGQNLCGVTLTTNYSGLTFSSINNPDWSTGTSMTAIFTIASGATAGNALVTLHARGGDVNFYFGITQSGQGPTISSISPASGAPGSAISVTISGSNLIAPALSTTWSGLTFSNVVPNSSGTSLTATFNISGSAATGNPPVKVTTTAGNSTTSLFSISSGGSMPLFWKKDYIQDDSGQVIATAAPAPVLDTSPPSTPSGLGHTGLTSTSVTLNWNVSTDTGGSNLAGYRIYRQRGSEANLPIAIVGPFVTSYIDPTLQSGTQYTFRLVAFDGAQNQSSASAGDTFTTP